MENTLEYWIYKTEVPEMVTLDDVEEESISQIVKDVIKPLVISLSNGKLRTCLYAGDLQHQNYAFKKCNQKEIRGEKE